MSEYIELNSAVCIADYAADEHPYEKDMAKPETFSEYNQGWNDACDYIRNRLEEQPAADVVPVRHGKWLENESAHYPDDHYCVYYDWHCSNCGETVNDRQKLPKYCPECGARMDLETIDNG